MNQDDECSQPRLFDLTAEEFNYQNRNQLTLFNSLSDSKESKLEKLIEQKNNLKAFGVTKKALNTISEDSIRIIYRGMHNIKVPIEILEKLNPDEVISVFYFSGLHKRFNSHLSSVNLAVIPKDFERLMDYIYRSFKEFRNGSYHTLAKNLEFPVEGTDRGRIKRYSSCSREFQGIFMSSFIREYIPSDRENPMDLRRYIEPEDPQECIEEVYNLLKGISNHAKKKNSRSAKKLKNQVFDRGYNAQA